MEKNGKNYIVGFDEDSMKEVLIETTASIGNLDDDAFGMIKYAQRADENELKNHSAKELEFLISNLYESRLHLNYIINYVDSVIKDKKFFEESSL